MRDQFYRIRVCLPPDSPRSSGIGYLETLVAVGSFEGFAFLDAVVSIKVAHIIICVWDAT